MTTEQKKSYYDATAFSEIRPDLLLAIQLTDRPKIAIDCGCGAGANIAHLLERGFTVYGFDLEEESISRCKLRFSDNEHVILSQDSFSTFQYPKVSLVLADASLFFCPKKDFENVWQKIYECLNDGGIFCGSFLGAYDTMASSNCTEAQIWTGSLIFNEMEVKSVFMNSNNNFEICRFTEHRFSGKTVQGVPHDWHLFSVVARKTRGK